MANAHIAIIVIMVGCYHLLDNIICLFLDSAEIKVNFLAASLTFSGVINPDYTYRCMKKQCTFSSLKAIKSRLFVSFNS